MPFKIKPHTSELKVSIYARSKKNLFKEAINCLGYLLGGSEIKKNKPAGIKEISISTNGFFLKKDKNLESENIMLINLINEILACSHTYKKIYFFSKWKIFSKRKITVICKTIKADGFENDIKAATFHGGKITNKRGLWKINLIFDI